MKTEVKSNFTLTKNEVSTALYDFYVRRFREHNINVVFSEKDIIIECDDEIVDNLEVSLVIIEITEL